MGNVTGPALMESSGEAVGTAGEIVGGCDDHRGGGGGEARAAGRVVPEQHEADEHGGEQAGDVYGVASGRQVGTGELGESHNGSIGGDEKSDEFE